MADDDAVDIPLQSNIPDDDEEENTVTLPSSPKSADADVTIALPFVTPAASFSIQAKRALLVRNALVAAGNALVAAARDQPNDGAVDIEAACELVQALPGVRSGEAFEPVKDTLARIVRAAQPTTCTQMGAALVVLVQGDVHLKLRGVLELLCGPSCEQLPVSRIKNALQTVLVAITALFEDPATTDADRELSSTIAASAASEATDRIAELLDANVADEGDEASISLERFMEWIESGDTVDVLPWLPLMDCAKWPSLKRLTSVTSSTKSPRSPRSKSIPETNGTEGEFDDEEEYDDGEEVDSALRFRFSGVDGGTIVVNGDVAVKLLSLLKKSALTKLYSNTMYETFVQHTSDGLLEEDTFMEAVEELVAMTGQPQLMQDDEFLDCMLNIFRAFLPENCTKVDAFEIAAGMSLFVWGSKSDKLRSAFHYFDADSKEFLNRQQLWRFLRSILIVLLCLSPPPQTVVARYGSIVELVESGEQEIMENVMDDGSEYDDEDQEAETPKKERSRSRAESELRQGVFCFEDFGDDSTIEIPLKKLSLSNGDLIQYEEFQRITRLHELELHRVLDVFEPYMENPSSAWMEKSSFDMCITDLLPPDIAHGVASAFGVNSNTPESVLDDSEDGEHEPDEMPPPDEDPNVKKTTKEAFEASKREKPLIYAFESVEDSSFLTFEPSDISTYLFMLRSTKLDELGVSQIYDALLAYATPTAEDMRDDQGGTGYTYAGLEEDEGAYLVITRARFYECVRNLVPKNDMSEKAQQTSSKLLSRIFNVNQEPQAADGI
ncbi:hypothetical protein ATCC90586_006391 [Pythium insidiosum]|nr:hypothetical protein ATCC90586_006391 [Pythium insidiosum]